MIKHRCYRTRSVLSSEPSGDGSGSELRGLLSANLLWNQNRTSESEMIMVSKPMLSEVDRDTVTLLIYSYHFIKSDRIKIKHLLRFCPGIR